jgi:uncharacterized protein YacL (UPF0231 family)
MSTLSNNLLEFILGLLSNEEEQRKYAMNKEAYLDNAGYSGCASEVEDVMRMSGDMKSVGHAKHDVSPAARTADQGHGHADYQAVRHVTEHHEHKHVDEHHQAVQNVTNNYAGATTTLSTQNTYNGDKYDIWADDEAQVALNGGVNLGEDVEIEGDFEYKPEDSFNEASVGGNGVAVANGDANTNDSFNTNGSGVQINDDTTIGDDLNNAPGANGSVVGGGHIGDSSSDDDVIIKDNNLVFGDDNQVDSAQAINDSEQSATTGGEVDVVEDSLIVEDSLNNNELEFESESGPGDFED